MMCFYFKFSVRIVDKDLLGNGHYMDAIGISYRVMLGAPAGASSNFFNFLNTPSVFFLLKLVVVLFFLLRFHCFFFFDFSLCCWFMLVFHC